MDNGDPVSQLEKIKAELRRLGALTGPLQSAVEVHSPFGMAQMPFEDWLAKVFLPRAYEAADTGHWPARSQVGTAAIRNFDGSDEYETLVGLLCEFDRRVEARARLSS